MQLSDFSVNKVEFELLENFKETQEAAEYVYDICLQLIKVKRVIRDDSSDNLQAVAELKQIIQNIKQATKCSNCSDGLKLLKEEAVSLFKSLVTERYNSDQVMKTLLGE